MNSIWYNTKWIPYIRKNIKRLYKNNKFKYQLQQGMINANYLMDHILYQIFKIILSILKSIQPWLREYQHRYMLTELKKGVTFKIKSW